MKVEKDKKTGKVKGEFGLEEIVMKKMELHEKGWKEKFLTKHNAKKEMMTLKQQLKNEEAMKEMLEEEKREKELERERILQKEQEQQKRQKMKVLLSVALAIVGTALLATGYVLGKAEGTTQSIGDMLLLIGFILLVLIWFLWRKKK